MEDSQALKHIAVCCPYCGYQFEVEPPSFDQKSQKVSEPFEVECVAYTRDIGRFDPKDEDKWLSSKGWSRIGKDYFSVISYEKIGILRINDPDIHIRYRVQGCPECHNLFDVYANYSVRDGLTQPLSGLWPHVFGKQSKSTSTISLYQGESWPIWLTRQFSRLFAGSMTAGAILIGIVLFCFGEISWLLMKPTDQWGLFLQETLLHLAAIISVCLVLIISNRYIKYLDKPSEFYESLNVRDQRSVNHWLNYTRCRIVGVQEKQRLPKLTQVDVFAGGGAVVSLLFTWAAVNRNWLVGGLGIILLVALLLNFIDIRAVVQNQYVQGNQKWILWGVTVALPLILVVAWLIQHPSINWIDFNQSVDLVFWIFVAYLLGTGTLFTESVASYVLITLSRIPMHLSPYNKYAQIKPLRRIQSYSAWTILVLFLTIITIGGIIITFKSFPIVNMDTARIFNQASVNWNWLLIWMSLALAAIFGALGISKGKLYLIIISAIYLVLYILSGNWNPVFNFGPIGINFINPPAIIPKITITLQSQLMVVGVFLTLLLIQHLVETDRIISQVVEATRNKFLNGIDHQISQINAYLQKSKVHPTEKSELTQLDELHKNVDTLNDLLNLRIVVEQSRDRPKFRGFQLLSPIITSLLVPIILEAFIKPLFG